MLFSQKLYDERKIGWIRAGTDICYYGNRYRRHGCSSALIYHTLSFSLTFKYPEDKCWVALYYPYTSSALKRYLSDRVAKHRARNVISWTAATPPAGGCDVVTLTGFASARAEIAKREYVFVIARLRPCEVQSTFLAQGLIDFLLSEGSPAATSLLRRYVFKVVPIANPGGVALGNAETDPSGADLHTAWGRRGGGAAGAVEAVEAMLAAVGPRTAFFVDLHGTCKRSNCFVSGYNALSSDVGSPLSEKVFAYLLWCARPDFFAFSDCRYENLPSTARGGGAGCGRAFVRREHGVLNSFSFSATSAGMTFGPLEGMHLNPAALLRLGEYLGEALHEYATASPSKKAGVISQIYAMYKQYYPDYAI